MSEHAETVAWFRCPECGLVFSDGQPDPGRAWCSCGTSDSFPVLVIDGTPNEGGGSVGT